jgi:hypothetical protein
MGEMKDSDAPFDGRVKAVGLVEIGMANLELF